MLQPFLRSASDGWALAVTSVRDLYAEADLRADEVGGDFAGESERLGIATAEVHQALAEAFGSRVTTVEENRSTAEVMRTRLAAAVAAVPELGPLAAPIRSRVRRRRLARRRASRCSGCTATSTSARCCGPTPAGCSSTSRASRPGRCRSAAAMMSPLRDIAGHAAVLRLRRPAPARRADRQPQLTYRAWEWTERNQSAFCDGYAKSTGWDPRGVRRAVARRRDGQGGVRGRVRGT